MQHPLGSFRPRYHCLLQLTANCQGQLMSQEQPSPPDWQELVLKYYNFLFPRWDDSEVFWGTSNTPAGLSPSCPQQWPAQLYTLNLLPSLPGLTAPLSPRKLLAPRLCPQLCFWNVGSGSLVRVLPWPPRSPQPRCLFSSLLPMLIFFNYLVWLFVYCLLSSHNPHTSPSENKSSGKKGTSARLTLCLPESITSQDFQNV